MRLIQYRFGDYVLDPAVRELRRNGERLPLPLKSLECLVYLVANRQRAVGRDELISAVWGRAEVSDTVITQTMRRARKALDDAGDRQTMIRTVPGFGYRWVAEVEELEPGTMTVPMRTTEPDDDGAGVVPSAPAPVPVPVSVLGRDEPEAPAGLAQAIHDRNPSNFAVRWRMVAAVLVVVLCVSSSVLWWNHRSAPSSADVAVTHPSRVIVLPVRVAPGEADVSWVRLGAMEYAADRLRGAALQVTPTEQTLHLDAALPDAQSPDAAALRQLLDRSEARWLLLPTAQHNGTQWRVQLRAVDSSADISVEALGDTPLQAMAVATDTWLRRIARVPADRAVPTELQERLRRIDAELDAGQLESAREQIQGTPRAIRDSPPLQVREGQLEYRAGRMGEAARLFDSALAHKPAATPGVRAKGLMGLGAVALRSGDPATAQARYTDALALLAEASSVDTRQLGNAYNGRGVAQVQLGNLDAAVADLGQARVAMRRSGDDVSAAMVGANLGRMEGMRSHWPQALQEFDSAIAVFERFQVNDYLAATLAAKAQAQLETVQPAQAKATLARTDGLLGALEDGQLVAVIQLARGNVALANGELGRVDAAVKALARTGSKDPSVSRLRMAVAVARGDSGGAGRLAGSASVPVQGAVSEIAAIAVQAAAGQEDGARWLGPGASARHAAAAPDPATFFAKAMLQHRFGPAGQALRDAQNALAVANRDGSPNDRVRANLLRAAVLLDANQPEQAVAVLGELDAYASTDYRVAWWASALYKRRGDAASARQAQQQAAALAGERPLGTPPLL